MTCKRFLHFVYRIVSGNFGIIRRRSHAVGGLVKVVTSGECAQIVTSEVESVDVDVCVAQPEGGRGPREQLGTWGNGRPKTGCLIHIVTKYTGWMPG